MRRATSFFDYFSETKNVPRAFLSRVARNVLLAHLAEFSSGAQRLETRAADVTGETAAHAKAERGMVAVITGEGEGADSAEEVSIFHGVSIAKNWRDARKTFDLSHLFSFGVSLRALPPVARRRPFPHHPIGKRWRARWRAFASNGGAKEKF